MSRVGIFFFPPWLGGGSTTFTAHLHSALQFAGRKPSIYRVVDSEHSETKPFGDYPGISYQTITLGRALKIAQSQPTIMSAVAAPPHVRDGVLDALLGAGTRAVIHDDGEAARYDWSRARRPICIRKATALLVPGAVYLPHPFVRSPTSNVRRRATRGAVSVARVARSKRTEIILSANRLLPKTARVSLLGMEDKPYADALAAGYPDVFAPSAQSGPKFPFSFAAPVSQCRGAEFHVDMSWFARDGGGTQYSQLEAMDAGAINVMHEDWFRFGGDVRAGVHAVAIRNERHLATVLLGGLVNKSEIASQCEILLRSHDARAVGVLYSNELLRGS